MFQLNHFSFFKSFTPPFGLDISDLSLKLVGLDKTGSVSISKKNKSISLLLYNQIEVPPGYFNQGKIVKTDKIVGLIKKLIKNSQSSKTISDYVISVLPETKAFIKLIEIPNVPEEEIAAEISKEIQNHFPFSPDEIYLDWERIPDFEREKIKILVSIAPKEIVDSYTNLLLAAELKPFALEIESSAICRSLLPCEANPSHEDKSKPGLAILDIGATRTSLIVYDKETIQFTTSVPFSGQEVSQRIADKLKIDFKEAEKAKIKCGLTDKKCQGVLRKLLYYDIQSMITKVRNSLAFYQNHFPQNDPIKKIITCGGGANFQGINEILEQGLDLKVETGDPLVNINQKNIKIPKEQVSSYATAIGLALRGVLMEN